MHHPRQRNEEQTGWHEVGGEDGDAQWMRKGQAQSRERVTRGHRDQQRDRHDSRADDERVQHPRGEARLLEQVLDIAEGRRLVEPERVIRRVVEVAVGFEDGDDHPVQGERRHHRVDRNCQHP